jgi:DNA (cytosine-5)-methyltransferase 1
MNREQKRVQLSLFDEIIVDNFAGGGGASTGIELATGRPVTIAINHDSDAILMHKTNHPFTTHYQESVWDIDPIKICEGRPVGLAWFSPDCKHFSKAKGGKPVSKNIRGLAWIVLKWAGTVRPRVIMLENVEEFQTWGPVRRGRPVKSKIGETFRRWLSQLRDLGYDVDYRELVAADYGAPTTRKRFFLIARCDGRSIIWPEPTHAPADHPDIKVGKKKAWRSAAEIIDWSIPAPSIFATKAEVKEQYGVSAVRPLARDTMRRVARGLDKFVLKSAKPFIVPIGYGERDGQAPRVHNINEPIPTCVRNGKHYVCAPTLIQYHTEQSEHVRGQGITDPVMTVDAANRYGLVAGTLVKYYSNDQHGQPLDSPLHTVTVKDREGVLAASLMKYFGGVTGAEIEMPLPTVTAKDHNALQLAHIAEFKGQDKGQDADRPLRTITASIGEFAVVHTTIRKYRMEENLGSWPEIRMLLNEYCGYHLEEDEILLMWIADTPYYMCDIGLRMLTPRELYAANGFPPDYIIDRDYTGRSYSKSKQVARCGNAVPPPFATALVRANLPEWCSEEIRTMDDLEKIIAI